MKHLRGIYPLPNPPPEMGRGLAPSPSQGEGWGEGGERLLILVGLTGSGKTTTVNALRDHGCDFLPLPNRRDLTDRLIIAHLQQLDGEPAEPVTNRAQRFAYTRRYRELYPGGMACALSQYSVYSIQCTVHRLLVFDGLRGENEVTYAAQNMPEAWFLFLDAPDFVRVQRLLKRNDVFDQITVNEGDGYRFPHVDHCHSREGGNPQVKMDSCLRRNDNRFGSNDDHPLNGNRGETAVTLDPSLTTTLDNQQITQLESLIQKGELTIDDIHAKLTIVQKERQNYDPDATLSALHQHAPDRLIYADTVTNTPEEIAQQVIESQN